jgi:hypothetical protein
VAAGRAARLADFTRLLSWPFAHLLSAHGRPLLHEAHARLARTVARAGLA